MKWAVILHGTASTSQNNWFPWLKTELEKLGYEVWVPDLPDAEQPNIDTYNKFLLSSGWDFNDNLIIGHSSGSVAILGLLQALPENVKIDTAILIGTFRGNLDRDDLKDVDVSYDYKKIKSKAKQFIVIHSDNDPYCPLDGAEWVAGQLGAKVTLIPGQQHFSSHLDPKYVKFPEIVEIIKNKVNL